MARRPLRRCAILRRHLSRDGLNIIAELKPASPSRGVIREPFDAPELAKTLAHAGAAALSVLTEGEFFHGSLKNMRDARKAVPVPVLRKDFIFDPWQVWEARANDADSFLLIVAALEDGLLRELMYLGREIGMEPVVEVHTCAELERAVRRFGAHHRRKQSRFENHDGSCADFVRIDRPHSRRLHCGE